MVTDGARRHNSTHRVGRLAYPATLALLLVALAFPFALMVFDPTLMFQRGWEQYAGTGFYLWAVLTLIFELTRLWRNEGAFEDAGDLLDAPARIDASERRTLPARLRHLTAHAAESVPAVQLMELNREASSLDQEHAHGRFTLTRYIVYLLPVIGFIGTVEGISKALINISKVLPLVKELDGFLSNLTGVTAALQIAFDSTLLALFLSAALMLVQTLVIRRSDDLLARVDGWVVEHVLPRLGAGTAPSDGLQSLAQALEQLRLDLAHQNAQTGAAFQSLSVRLDSGFAANIDRFAAAVDRLGPALASMEHGASQFAAAGASFEEVAGIGETTRKLVAILGRIEMAVEGLHNPGDALEPIRRGVDRVGTGVESLAGQWSAAFEKSSRVTQEQLARTLGSLKDALELLHVSIDQGNSLYRSIVKKLVPYSTVADDKAA